MQCCVCFCHTTWISRKYTYVPSLLDIIPPSCPPPHPTLWVVTEHRIELPVLYSSFPLAYLFLTHGNGNVYVSVLLSHLSHHLLLPPSPQACSVCLQHSCWMEPFFCLYSKVQVFWRICVCVCMSFVSFVWEEALLHLQFYGSLLSCRTLNIHSYFFSFTLYHPVAKEIFFHLFCLFSPLCISRITQINHTCCLKLYLLL